MSNKKGFTLIEAMIAAGVLVIGVVGVSGMFSYSIRTNVYTEQMTTGVLLANAKAEELGSKGLPGLPIGGGLDPAAPTAGYFEYMSVADDGTITTSTVDTTLRFLRMWQISGNNPRLVTVSVHAQSSGISGNRVELVRTTSQVAN